MREKVLREKKVTVLDRPVARYRRHIVSGQLYEITMRVRRGLPFVQNETINLLLLSSMAQACFVSGVRVSHFLWMTNHLHVLIVAKDPESLTKFYGVLSKVVTDHFKRLLNIPRLRLWEGRVSVIRILDPDTAVKRIAYFYANPANDFLVSTISEYPGLSSYQKFLKLKDETSVGILDMESVPWIRPKYIVPIKTNRLNLLEDRQIVRHLTGVSYYVNKFIIAPNDWMKPFGITDAEAPAWNSKIVASLKQNEREAAENAKKEQKKIVGAKALRRGRIFADHIPKKDGKRIFFIGRDLEVHVRRLKKLNVQCAELFWKYARHGIPTLWPPGVFPPRPPICACALV